MPKAIRSSLPFSKNPNQNPHSIGVRRTRDDDAADVCAADGARLRRYRQLLGLTLEEVGGPTETNIATLSLAERGIEPMTPARQARIMAILRSKLHLHAMDVADTLATVA